MFEEIREILKRSLDLYALEEKGTLKATYVDNGFTLDDVGENLDKVKLEYGLLSSVTSELSGLEIGVQDIDPSYKLPLIVPTDRENLYQINSMFAQKIPEYVAWQKWRYEGIKSGKFTDETFPSFDMINLPESLNGMGVLESNIEFPLGELAIVSLLDEETGEAKEVEVIATYSSVQDASLPFMYRATIMIPGQQEEKKESPFLVDFLPKANDGFDN